MRPYEDIDIHARNLPHWHQDNTLVFITWRLADSLPESKLREIENTQKMFLKEHPEPWDETTLRLYRKNVSREMEAFLDSGCGACVMKDERVRQAVESALRFFDGQRYRLHAFVVMPNHVHVLYEAFPDYQQNKILHTWKSYTANVINKMLGRQGRLWQDESWDRLIRNESHYRNCVDYIRDNNPRLACILAGTGNTGSIGTGSTGILPVHSDLESIGTGSIGILPVHSQNRQDACSPSERPPARQNRQDACSPSEQPSVGGAQ